MPDLARRRTLKTVVAGNWLKLDPFKINPISMPLLPPDRSLLKRQKEYRRDQWIIQQRQTTFQNLSLKTIVDRLVYSSRLLEDQKKIEIVKSIDEPQFTSFISFSKCFVHACTARVIWRFLYMWCFNNSNSRLTNSLIRGLYKLMEKTFVHKERQTISRCSTVNLERKVREKSLKMSYSSIKFKL